MEIIKKRGLNYAAKYQKNKVCMRTLRGDLRARRAPCGRDKGGEDGRLAGFGRSDKLLVSRLQTGAQPRN
jgi:hypothetical protein